MQEVRRWARFVREHPREWKKEQTKFINALFSKQREVYARLSLTEKGREKIQRLQEMRGKV